MAEQFAEAGIEIVAIGLEGPEAVAESLGGDSDTGFPFRVLCGQSRTQFKAWRAYDDFEDIALHGTYLVTARGGSGGSTSATCPSWTRSSAG